MSRKYLLYAVAVATTTLLASCTEAPRNPVGLSKPVVPHMKLVSSTNSFGNGAVTASVTANDTVDCGDTTSVAVALTGSTVPQNLDLVAVMDASGSIGGYNWNRYVVPFGEHLASVLQPSPTGNRMGIVEFASYARDIWRLSQTQTTQALITAFRRMPYTGGYTFTRSGMAAALQQFSAAPRPGAAKAIVLVTDGQPDPPTTQSPCDLAPTLKRDSIHTIIIGVGNFDPQPIACLVQDPSTDIIRIQNYSQLFNVFGTLEAALPRVSQATYTATVPTGFQLNGSPTAGAGSVTVSGNTISWTVKQLGASTVHLTIPLKQTTATGDTALLTKQSLSYATASGSKTEALGDVKTLVVGCDTTPPVIKPEITGTLGNNGWYISDVTLNWSVTDPQSAVTSKTGCGTSTVDTDTKGETFSCSATSAGGTDTVSTTIKRDATPPVITFTGNKGTYEVIDTVAITCTASDATSGVASTTCTNIDAFALNLGLGMHTDSATATDNAGNRGSGKTSFNIIVTVHDLEVLTQEWVSQHGVANALVAKLKAADKAHTTQARAGELQAYLNQLAAQSGKVITAAHAATLTQLTRSLM